MIARASLTKSFHSSWWAKSVTAAAKLSWSGRSPGARAGRRGTGLPTDRAKDGRAQALTRMQKQQRATLAALDDIEGGSGERHRPGHLAASLFCFASSAAKWRATALAAAALRLALNPSLLARIQSIDCERHRLRSSKRGNT